MPSVPASRNTSFVERDGDRLLLDGETFRFSGTNIYWLGLDENVPPGVVDYPTHFRIRNAIDTAANLGVSVVRSHMLASTGTEKAILPSKEDGYNDEAFASIDYAVAYAGAKGLRLILPLTDEWAYYHGGHRDFAEPYGLCTEGDMFTPCPEFYSDPRVVADFEDYVRHVMDHVNPYTGLALKDDPTVLAWELGNELEGMTPTWIDRIAGLVAERAPDQLVAAGRRFGVDDASLASERVDIVDVHYYPPTVDGVRADAQRVTASGKVYVAGEYASTAATPGLLGPLAEDSAVTGMMFWSLFGHDDVAGLVQHDDGFTTHYPGTDDRMREAVDAVRSYSAALTGIEAPIEVKQPLITRVDSRFGFHEVLWRGAAGAATYRLERSQLDDGEPTGPWTVVADGLVDGTEPFLDTSSGADVAYRVVPVGADGHDGPVSAPAVVTAGEDLRVDPLESLRPLADHAGVGITPSGTAALLGPVADTGAHATWEQPRLRSVELRVRAKNPARVRKGLDLASRSGDSPWAAVDPTVRRVERGVYAVSARTPVGTDRLRVTWLGGSEVRMADLALRSADRAPGDPELSTPGAFSAIGPDDGASAVRGVPTLRWEDSEQAAVYRVSVAPADTPEAPLVEADVQGTSYTPSIELDPGTAYRWHVEAVNGAGSTAMTGGPRTFTTDSLPTSPQVVDDYESYADGAALTAAYVPNAGGDPITSTLAPGDGDGQAMRLSTDLASSGYAGVTRTFPEPRSWWGYSGLDLWLDRTSLSAGQSVTVQIAAGGQHWETVLPEVGPRRAGVVHLPFDDFAPPPWAGGGGRPDLQDVTEISFYLGGSGPAELVVDDVRTSVAGD